MTTTPSQRAQLAYETWRDTPADGDSAWPKWLAVAEALRLYAGADWVSVEDRLPGPAEHVEVWPDPHDDTYSFYAHHNGGTNGVKAGRWYYSDREGYDREIRVTHWRQSQPGPEVAAPRHETGEG